MDTPLKKRYGVLAVVMSLIAPGLGFLYAGKWRLAVATPFIILLPIAIGGWSRLVLNPGAFTYLLFITVAVFLAVIIGSFIVARKNSPCQLKRSQRWYVYLLFIVCVWVMNPLLSAARAPLFGYETFRYPSVSMSDTLVPGDDMLIDTWAYNTSEPKRGDIVVFKYPEDTDVKYAKRLIAKSGDKVAVDKGQVLINDQPLDEPYVLPANNIRTTSSDSIVLTVPENHYFVLGDNRDNSNDSRYWGFVPRENIHGKAFYLWGSFDNVEGVRMDRIGKVL